jgi:tRNA nucleotidyltransferase/poly(A) polymerase
LLSVPLKDLDFVISGDPNNVGRALVREFGGHVFWLREEEEVARVLLDGFQLDFTVLRGSLEEDLRARDLTINAMAIPLNAGIANTDAVIDPTGGRADLLVRSLRLPARDAIERDPLRVLRTLRFRWKLDFGIEPETATAMRAGVPLMARVSGERVRDELFQLLELPAAPEALAECVSLGLIPRLVGSDAAGEGVESRMCDLLALVQQGPEELTALLATVPVAPRRRRELLLWAAALQAMHPPPDPGRAGRCLALGNEERQLLTKALASAPEAARIAREWPVPGRERYRLFRASGAAGPEAVLLAGAAEGWSPAYNLLLAEALRRVLSPEQPLLTGTDIMRIAELRPGPKIGKLMERLEEARADGLLATPEEAEAWVRAAAQKSD